MCPRVDVAASVMGHVNNRHVTCHIMCVVGSQVTQDRLWTGARAVVVDGLTASAFIGYRAPQGLLSTMVSEHPRQARDSGVKALILLSNRHSTCHDTGSRLHKRTCAKGGALLEAR